MKEVMNNESSLFRFQVLFAILELTSLAASKTIFDRKTGKLIKVNRGEEKSRSSGVSSSRLASRRKVVKGRAQELLLIRKFVRTMKGKERKRVNGQMFEKAANVGAYQRPSSSVETTAHGSAAK